MDIQLQKPNIDLDGVKTRVEGFLVENSNQYLLASNELIMLKRHRNVVVAFFAEMKSSAHATWKAIVGREKSFTDQIDTLESILKRKMLAFTAEQERVRREREAELQREADAKAEAERKRLIANAKANTKRGNELNAEMYRNAAANCAAPVIVIASSTPKAAGISTCEVWHAEVTNKQAFIAAAAAEPELAKFITIDVVGLCRAGWRGDLAGVRFYKEEILSARAS